jgi:hypothetical protein
MGAVNLGTWRIVIIVVLVVAGVAILANGFDDTGTAVAGPTATGSPAPDGDDGATESPDPDASPTDSPSPTPEPSTTGVLVKVFNGTNAPGLAGEVQETLEADQYVAPDPATDAPAKPVKRTTVYYRGGQNEDQNRADATYIAENYIEPVLGGMPRVDELSSVYTQELVPNTVTVVVLIGDDYVAAIAA